MGRDGRVIDLRVPTGREGGRCGGRGRESVVNLALLLITVYG